MSWKKHFRVVSTNAAPTAPAVPEVGGTGTASKYSSYLPEVYAGHPNRIQRYYQYDDMDRDSDINAALDTIADFCTQSEEQNENPFFINYTDQANETEVKLLKSALDRWVKINDFRSRLWYMFRNTIKNGDAFFLRDPETAEWLWLDHYSVEMVKVDDEGGKEPDEYVVRGLDLNRSVKFATKKADPNIYRTPMGTNVVQGARPLGLATTGGMFQLPGANRDPRQMRPNQQQQASELFVIDAQNVVHLSLSVGMDINWPFGQSVLEPVFKTYKQKELLEDSIIIYRVQRAPERRVFKIDVGNMPPPRAKAHIEAIKNEIHQRRIPNRTGGGSSIMDAAYNPLSIMEDFFFAQCLRLTTEIPLLDGRTLTLAEIISEHEAGKVNYTYSLDTKTHKFEPGKIVWAGVTRRDAEMLRVHLDNGKFVDATPDHRFILRDGSEIEARNLAAGMSLMPLYLDEARSGPNQFQSRYARIKCNATGKKRFVHTEVCPKPKGREFVVHHVDFDCRNNNPDNLVVMDSIEHAELHRKAGSYSLRKQWSSEEGREKLIAGMRRLYDDSDDTFRQMLSERNSRNGTGTWNKPEAASRALASLRKHSADAAKRKTVQYPKPVFDRLVELFNEGHDSISKLKIILPQDEVFRDRLHAANPNIQRDRPDVPLGSWVDGNTLAKIVKQNGYSGWSDFKSNIQYNHKVVGIEVLPFREDTGDITVESASGSHVFAVAAGIYVHNSSEGRGSSVETLPGGDNLGEIGDLTFFTRKMARGLRIPSSYLSLGNEEPTLPYSDGKLGTALIQEFRFNKYCMRLQTLLAPVFDKEFKHFLREKGIEIENSLFELQFNPPQNFAKYRQIELDSQQVGVYQQVSENKKLSERFKLKRFLNLTEDELIENEKLWAEENAAKLKRTTGSTPAETNAGETDLSAVGIRPGDDFGMDMPPMDAEGDLGGDMGDMPPPEGGAMPGAPMGGAPAPGGAAAPAAPPPAA